MVPTGVNIFNLSAAKPSDVNQPPDMLLRAPGGFIVNVITVFQKQGKANNRPSPNTAEAVKH
jgi:hypothetical protein